MADSTISGLLDGDPPQPGDYLPVARGGLTRKVSIGGVIGIAGVQSVTGLDTDNTDPQNPIVKIAIDPATLSGLGTPASPLAAQPGGDSILAVQIFS